MDLDKFLNKTDIQLYRGILHKIYKDFDNMEPSVLGDLLDKLKELHNELDKVVQQKNTQQMYNTPYVKRLDILKIKKDKEELEKMKNKEKFNKEYVNTNGVLLSDIYREIRDNKGR
jgi:regulator of replication initiation timing